MIVGIPDQIRQPLFIDDMAKIIENLDYKNLKGILNLAGPDKINIIDFLKKLEKIIRNKSKIKIINNPNLGINIPKNSTLNLTKLNKLKIKTTSINDAIKKIKNQIK